MTSKCAPSVFIRGCQVVVDKSGRRRGRQQDLAFASVAKLTVSSRCCCMVVLSTVPRRIFCVKKYQHADNFCTRFSSQEIRARY